jgi:hypothetical protein
VRQVRLEAAPAARFVHSGRAHDDQVLRSDQPLRMHGGISTLHADGKKLGDFFGYGKQARHGLKGATEVIGVETCDDHALPGVCHAHANVNKPIPEELAFVDPDHFGPRLDFLENFDSVPHDLGWQLEPGMGNNVRLRVPLVDDRLEDLHTLPGDFGALQAPNQFFTLA